MRGSSPSGATVRVVEWSTSNPPSPLGAGRKLIGDAEEAGLSRIVEKNTRTLGKLETIIDALEQAGPQQIVAGGKVTDLDATG